MNAIFFQLKEDLGKVERKLEQYSVEKSDILLEHGKLEQEQKVLKFIVYCHKFHNNIVHVYNFPFRRHIAATEKLIFKLDKLEIQG